MFKSQVLVLRGDDLTCPAQYEIYRKAVGSNISSVPNIVAKGILRLNAHLQEMYVVFLICRFLTTRFLSDVPSFVVRMDLFEKTSAAVAEGKVPEFEGQLDMARKAAVLGGGKLRTFEEWASEGEWCWVE